jgi:2-hydroxychromene-2-carboxylate isomerase
MHLIKKTSETHMIDFYFDCSSPWSYIAFRNIHPMAKELRADINYKPVLVGGIFNTVNKNVYAAREDMGSARNRYLLKDVQDNAAAARMKLVFPPTVFPVNSVKAMRGCLWIAQDAKAKAHYLAFVEAAFAAFLEGITQPTIKEQLKANTDEAIARGAFGVPTFFVADDMYFGNDRLELVKAALLKNKNR